MRPNEPYKIFVGFDAEEIRTVNVAIASMRQRSSARLYIDRISRITLLRHYNRPTSRMPNGQLYDEISEAPMSTDHAIARFFVPFICGYSGWALFVDGDVMLRDDVAKLFALADERFAVQVVKHGSLPEEGEKKVGHVQSAYPMKNWSSVMLMNCGHPANSALTEDVLNAWPGRDLHAFRWLDRSLIGELPSRWNYLVGLSEPDPNPALVHYTLGTPDMPGHATDDFADEWFDAARTAGYKDLPKGAAVGLR